MCGEVQKLASELLLSAHSEDPIKGPGLVQPDGDGVVTV